MIRLKDKRHKIYSFTIDSSEVYRRCQNRSRTLLHLLGVNDNALVLGKNSAALFTPYFDTALSDALDNLARFMRRGEILSPDGKIYDSEDKEVTYTPWQRTGTVNTFQIILPSAREEAVLPTLSARMADYLTERVLEIHFGRVLASEGAMQKITDVLNFSARPLCSRIDPLF